MRVQSSELEVNGATEQMSIQAILLGIENHKQSHKCSQVWETKKPPLERNRKEVIALQGKETQ